MCTALIAMKDGLIVKTNQTKLKMTKTLEQKAKLTATETKTLQRATITAECHYCGRELQIPGHPLKPNREYSGVYISPCGSPYCDKDCFNMFTED